MIQKSKNLFASAIEEEMNDIIKMYSDQEGTNVFEHVNNEGHILLPIKISGSSLAEEIETEPNESNEDYETLVPSEMDDFNIIFNDIKMHNIIKMEATPSILKEFLVGLYKTKAKDIYGVMISFENTRYNPLHPITASMIASGEIVLPDKFQLIVYEYFSKASVSDEPEEYHIDKIMSILGLIKKNVYKAKGISKYVEMNEVKELADSEDFMSSKFNFDLTADARPKYSICPIQFMTKDIVVPYYGVVTSQIIGTTYSSLNLTPMFSCNIALNEDAPNRHWDNTCTGNQPNSMFRSLYTLNDMNCNSVYHNFALNGYYQEWVYACMMTSIYIMYKDIVTLIDDEERIEEERKTVDRKNELMKNSKSSLYKILIENNINGYSRATKEELVNRVIEYEEKELLRNDTTSNINKIVIEGL